MFVSHSKLGLLKLCTPTASWSLVLQAMPEVSAVVGVALFLPLLYFPLFLSAFLLLLSFSPSCPPLFLLAFIEE